MRFIVVLMALMMNVACADQTPPVAKEAQAAVVAGDSTVAIDKLRQAFPGIPVAQVEPSTVPGMFMVLVQGEWLHVSADGRFVFAGEVFELRDGEGAVGTHHLLRDTLGGRPDVGLVAPAGGEVVADAVEIGNFQSHADRQFFG